MVNKRTLSRFPDFLEKGTSVSAHAQFCVVMYLENQVSWLQSAILSSRSLLQDILNVDHALAAVMSRSRHDSESQSIVTYNQKSNC